MASLLTWRASWMKWQVFICFSIIWVSLSSPPHYPSSPCPPPHRFAPNINPDFMQYVNCGFTSDIESQLDEVAGIHCSNQQMGLTPLSSALHPPPSPPPHLLVPNVNPHFMPTTASLLTCRASWMNLLVCCQHHVFKSMSNLLPRCTPEEMTPIIHPTLQCRPYLYF